MTSIRSVRNEDIQHFPIDIVDVDLLQALPSSQEDAEDPGALRILRYQDAFTNILGPEPPRYSLLLTSHTTSRNPFFANACVHLPAHDELYLTSSLLQPGSAAKLPQVLISRVALTRAPATVDNPSPEVTAAVWQKMRAPPSMPNPAGACAYEDGVVYCAKTSPSGSGGGGGGENGGGLVYMPRSKKPPQVVSRYGGRPFSSPQRVAKSPADDSLWFTTDADDDDSGIQMSGALNGGAAAAHRRSSPSLVYRHDNRDGSTRVVADGFAKPGAIAFSRDGTTAYISDVKMAKEGEEGFANSVPAIYAFDVIIRHGQPFLGNKRVFAVPFEGVAADMQCDVDGNVFVACGDGVEIWSPGGVPLGLIEIFGGCSCLCFGNRGELFIGAGQRLWRVQF
ncbi:hypothetical protein E8E14_002766 [Neopestalotiopsis sp. 37M]|nr:hypothetical protein E8E14_002766 [Neopestalotiopsis sp. 37M]